MYIKTKNNHVSLTVCVYTSCPLESSGDTLNIIDPPVYALLRFGGLAQYVSDYLRILGINEYCELSPTFERRVSDRPPESLFEQKEALLKTFKGEFPGKIARLLEKENDEGTLFVDARDGNLAGVILIPDSDLEPIIGDIVHNGGIVPVSQEQLQAQLQHADKPKGDIIEITRGDIEFKDGQVAVKFTYWDHEHLRFLVSSTSSFAGRLGSERLADWDRAMKRVIG